jgi:SAM-dependent methyltransferase
MMKNKVRAYYNKYHKEEHRRLKYHAFELPLTMHFIMKYLPKGSKIFDTACGTGIYARHLLENNYYLGLNDLSDLNIHHVQKQFGDNEDVLFIERNDILDSKRWDEHQWDAVLILGPMYHLISQDRRLELLKKAASSIRDDGFIFTSFMTRTGALIYGIKNNPEGVYYPDGAEKLWNTGSDDSFVEATKSFSNAYFSHPSEIEPILLKAGLKPLHLAGAEGVFSERFELFHDLDPNLRKAWLKFILRHCEEMEMVYNSKHLLSVSNKK